MKHKYVVIDSSKENHNSVDAKFKVQRSHTNLHFTAVVKDKYCITPSASYSPTWTPPAWLSGA